MFHILQSWEKKKGLREVEVSSIINSSPLIPLSVCASQPFYNILGLLIFVSQEEERQKKMSVFVSVWMQNPYLQRAESRGNTYTSNFRELFLAPVV